MGGVEKTSRAVKTELVEGQEGFVHTIHSLL